MPPAGGRRGRPKGEGVVGESPASGGWVKKADGAGDGDHGGEEHRPKGKSSGKSKGSRQEAPVGARASPPDEGAEASGKGKGKGGFGKGGFGGF
mmetsp:Transcript_88307/g.239372  ORF Transcript_88307/g.239372 Transcript_88307/m.239372 type:complete len:94 (+) Transcript_88307:76-357(+)